MRFWYNKTLNDTGLNAMTISQVVVSRIDIAEYEEFLTTKEHNDYFDQMQEYFRNVQAETGAKYVYVEHKISPDQIEYIFDSQKDSLGETDDMSTPEAHTSTESFHTEAQSSSLWGTLITGYAPLTNEKGEVIGAVGTDVDIHFIYNELAKRVGQIILYTLAMVILFSLLVYLTLSEEISRRRAAEKDLTKSLISIKNLLNHAGQGFLSFSYDLFIEPEYSLECLRLLGPELKNRSFPEVIYPNDYENRQFIKEVLLECLREKDTLKREVFLSLLPSDILLNNNYIEIAYKIIPDKHQEESEALMVILTDVTEKRELRKQMETERRSLKMIVQAVINRDDLLEVISDYLYFCLETVPNLVTSQEPLRNVIVDIKRMVHTFKGSFGHFEMIHMLSSLHKIEEEIKSFEQQESANCSGLGILLKNMNLEGFLREDLGVLQSTLGKNFLTDDKIFEIPESKLIELEDQITALLPSTEATILIAEIRKLRYRLFKELLLSYPNYVEGLAHRLDKQVYPLELKGGEFPVDTTKYQAFTKSLIHVFANCVDHGVESREDRVYAGKEECGRILCEMKLVDQMISLRIADDGKGLDIEGIKQKALRLGILNGEELARSQDRDIIPLVFEDGLSSKEDVSMFSGRGIGMAIVKQELKKIGGQLDIYTNQGVGTEFHFLLPI